MGYYYNFELNGFTTQEGTGDASPDNIRQIKNAGSKLVKMVLNGSENWIKGSLNVGIRDKYMRYVINSGKNAKVRGIAYCTVYKYFSNSVAYAAWDGIGIYGGEGYLFDVIVDKNEFPDVLAWKQNVSRLATDGTPIVYCYEPVDIPEATDIYTGIEITQGDEYRCEIIDLKDRLHKGDKVETNVQSEYDAYAEFDGSSDENWLLDSGSTAGADGSKRMWIKLTGPQTENTSDKAVPVAASNQLTAQSAETTYIAKAANCFDVVYSGAINMLHVRIAGISTVEALKTHLQSHPLRVFYKSASGGTGKNVRRETHNSKTRIITGTENGILFNPKYNSLSIKVDNLAGDKSQEQVPGIVKSSHFKTNAAVNGILAQPKYNQVTILSASVFDSTESAKAYLAQQYAAGTPVTIEYELAQPEVFVNEAIEPVYIKALQSHSFSGEEGTNLVYTRTSKFIDPKTNWRDLEFFNLDPDYSRIKADIEVIKEYTDSLYPDVSITNMPKEYSISDDIYSEVPNNIVKSIEQIRSGSITPDGYVQMSTYIDGQPAWNANELNTIENNVRLLYNMFVRQEDALQKLPVMLGIRGIT